MPWLRHAISGPSLSVAIIYYKAEMVHFCGAHGELVTTVQTLILFSFPSATNRLDCYYVFFLMCSIYIYVVLVFACCHYFIDFTYIQW